MSFNLGLHFTVEELIERKENCENKAIEFAKKSENSLSTFWYNASKCYQNKMMNTKIKESK